MAREENKLGIKGWALADRPREKLLLKGPRHLTDAELIAILIRSGNTSETAVDLSKRILSYYVNDLTKLAKASVKEFSKFNGIGEAKAISIVAALELSRRKRDLKKGKLQKITSSKDVDTLLRPELGDLSHEEFWVLLLNRANLVIGKHVISKGGQSSTVVDPKIIFKIALEQNAAAIILVHNHPSGNLEASRADIGITKKLVASGRMLDLPILDHVILTDHAFVSLADEGML